MPSLAGVVLAVEVALGPVYNEAIPQAPLEVEIPAGSMPAGRAEARLEGQSGGRLDHRVVFDMPHGRGARVRLFRDPLAGPRPWTSIDVVVTPSKGKPLTQNFRIDPNPPGAKGDVLFAATPLELDAFSSAVRRHTFAADAADVLSGIRVVDRSALAKGECRSLVEASLVIVRVDDWEPFGRELFECAVRGANVVFVGKPPPVLEGLAGGQAFFFGMGLVAYAHDFDFIAASAALDVVAVKRKPERLGLASMRQTMFNRSRSLGLSGSSIPGRGAILGVLLGYVALIGPIGWFVARRRRQAWVLWAWFPCVSIGAVALFAIVGSSSHVEVARLTLSRVTIEAPGFGGLAHTSVSLSGRDAENYRASLPWRDADLQSVARSSRFGSPFRQPAGSIELLENQASGRMLVRGVTVDAYGLASLGFVSPVSPRPVARAESLPDGSVRVVNDTTMTLSRTIVVVTGHAWADAGRLEPGKWRDVRPVRSALPDPPNFRERTFRDEILFWITRDPLPPEHSLVACEVESPSRAEVTTEPELPIRVEDVRVTIGPLKQALR